MTKFFGALTSLAVMVVIAICVFTLPVMLIWNYVLVDVFPTVNTVGFWQAFWLVILSGCLFRNASFVTTK